MPGLGSPEPSVYERILDLYAADRLGCIERDFDTAVSAQMDWKVLARRVGWNPIEAYERVKSIMEIRQISSQMEEDGSVSIFVGSRKLTNKVHPGITGGGLDVIEELAGELGIPFKKESRLQCKIVQKGEKK
jgi:hypothetical protein